MQPGQMSGVPPSTLAPSLPPAGQWQPTYGAPQVAPMAQAPAAGWGEMDNLFGQGVPAGRGEMDNLFGQGAPAGRGEKDNLVGKGAPMKSVDYIDVFPTMFNAFLFGLFIIPIWLTYSIGRDGQVRYWIGTFCSVVLLLPIGYLMLYAFHVSRRRPSKWGMIACLLGSCVVILLIADYTLLQAYSVGHLLMSRDCTSFDHKASLQVQWKAAKGFYNSCMQATAAKTGMTYDAAVNLYRIEDCVEYDKLKDTFPDWEYLAKLEETYSCSGWCTHDQPLWTFKAVKDSCSQVVADVMFNKVQWGMTQVVVYTVIALGITSVLLMAAGQIFQSAGMPW